MSVQLLEGLPDDDRFTAWTLERMADFVLEGCRDVNVIQLARDVTSRAGRSPRQAAELLLRWVRARIRYVPDPLGVELVQSPRETLQRAAGDCDDHSVLLATLASCIGIPAAFKAIALRAGAPFVHVYTELLLDGRWWAADTTQPHQLGWEAPHRERMRLEVRYA